ncbi:hypothetical protein ACTJJ0_32790 [Chitinophaga sp. 22321]|uniref:YcxB-like protein n=1 Tax=Chitinophaga hostae TaxID=2831022 RepID=A0ABS5J9C9_9BACT|nr:hypothetical protein [Chitinophaga hostae]MBS0031816.1 hypothetical protein [Chitinophaga hostae]
MVKYSLHQRNYLFHEKWFEIKADGLTIRNKQLLNSSEYYLKFEDIGIKTIKSKSGHKGWLIGVFFLAGISALLYVEEINHEKVGHNAYLFYLVAAILCFLAYLFTYKRLIYLAHNNNSSAITFLIDNPSKAELSDFIGVLKEKRKAYLLDKYGQISTLLSYEQQHQNILWLHNVDALSHEEYLSKKQELNTLFKSLPGIGDFHLS